MVGVKALLSLKNKIMQQSSRSVIHHVQQHRENEHLTERIQPTNLMLSQLVRVREEFMLCVLGIFVVVNHSQLMSAESNLCL